MKTKYDSIEVLLEEALDESIYLILLNCSSLY